MIDSILDSTKKTLMLDSEYTPFDQNIILFINSAFGTLHQLGIGPSVGFAIEDRSLTWDTFLQNRVLQNVAKQYVYLRVRADFDPPTTSFHLTAINEQIKELEWRLLVAKEELIASAVSGDIPGNSLDDVLDGGAP